MGKSLFNILFHPFDDRVDPTLQTAIKNVKKEDEIVKNALDFEFAFIGTSFKDARSRLSKFNTDLTAGDKMMHEVFKHDLQNLNPKLLDEFSQACTLIKNNYTSIIADFERLEKVSIAVAEAIDIVLKSKLDLSDERILEAVNELKHIQKSEYDLSKISHEIVKKFSEIFKLAVIVSREIDNGMDSNKEWNETKASCLQLIKHVSECRTYLWQIHGSLYGGYVRLQELVQIDKKLGDVLKVHMDMLEKGVGVKSEYSGEAYTTKDRRGALHAYADELDEQDKKKKKPVLV